MDDKNTHATYNPDNLLKSLREALNLKNDTALSRALEISHSNLSKIRHRQHSVSASLLIRMHEVSKLSVKELRTLMGDRRYHYRIGDHGWKSQSTD